jgi:pimeloyl-ACP methyl ester carboxylesterase
LRIGLVLLCAYAGAGCVPPRAAPPLALAPCTLERLDERAECGVVQVLEDPGRPEGRRLGIHVAVLRARTAAPAPDPLVVLAGGPGQGARSYAGTFARLFRALRRQRDLVFVDLRGTGASHALRCPEPGDDADPLLWRLATADVAACREALDADVRFYAHEHALADLDRVRHALGYTRVNVWGGSYGTRAALLYALAHPARVRTLVLDGAVPLAQRFPLSVPADARRALDRLLARCAGDTACAHAYPDLGGTIERLIADLQQPRRVTLAHPVTHRSWTIDLDWRSVASALRTFLYSPSHASLVPHVATRAAHGDWAPFFALLADMSAATVDTMALGLTLSVLCTEDVPRIAPGEIATSTADTWLGRAEIAWWTSACRDWPRHPVPGVFETAQPILPMPALILSGDNDPATPPRWGEGMAAHFESARHLVLPVAHNTTFSGCVPRLITQFIAEADANALDERCVAAIAWPAFTITSSGPRP